MTGVMNLTPTFMREWGLLGRFRSKRSLPLLPVGIVRKVSLQAKPSIVTDGA